VFGLPEAKGAIVTDVRPRTGGAARVGLAAGDVITKFNGQAVLSAQDLISRVAATSPDESVSIEYLREAGSTLEKRTAQVVLGERPVATRDDEEEARPLPIVKEQDAKPLGITVGDLTPTLAATYRLQGQKGVLVREINPDSFVADIKSANGVTAAIGTGDLIQRVNRVSVADTKAFTDLVSKLKKGDPVVLHVLTYSPSEAKPILKVVQFTVQ
jgi:serine protease Do